jgi:DNA-binding transcriptional LysR family regulator
MSMKRFSLAQLEAFLWICRLGTFRAAADRLNVTQPSISLRISELESAVGVQLFAKRGRPIRLSAAGTIMLRYVERGLDLFDEMEDILRRADPLHGLLRLGAVDTVAMTCLPEIVQALEVVYPQMKIELTITNNHALTELLNQNRLDIVFLLEPHLHASLWSEQLGVVDIAWLSSAQKPLGKKILRPENLADQNILTLTPPSHLNDIITNWLSADKTPAQSLKLCNNIAVIARFVISGLAVSVLPVCVVQRELDAGLIVRYRQRPELKPLKLYAAGQSALRSPAVSAILDTMREVLEHSGIFLRN